MTIENTSLGWSAVELAAQNHELKNVTTYKIPVDSPTVAQQLAFATTRCAELQARVHWLQGGANEALLWLSAGQPERARESLSRVILDI